MERTARVCWGLALFGNASLLWWLVRGAGFGIAVSIGLPMLVSAAAVYCLARMSAHRHVEDSALDLRTGRPQAGAGEPDRRAGRRRDDAGGHRDSPGKLPASHGQASLAAGRMKTQHEGPARERRRDTTRQRREP